LCILKNFQSAAQWSGPVTISFSEQQHVRTAVKKYRERWIFNYRYGEIVIKQIITRLIVVTALNLRISIKEGYIA
jgi:hypothetical protein